LPAKAEDSVQENPAIITSNSFEDLFVTTTRTLPARAGSGRALPPRRNQP
jgi:hypothetical protein